MRGKALARLPFCDEVDGIDENEENWLDTDVCGTILILILGTSALM